MTPTSGDLQTAGRAPAGPVANGRFGLGLVLTVVFAAMAAVAAMAADEGPVLCPIRRCTGGFCPGCGLTRSGGRLLRGDVAGAWAQHPYTIMALAQAAALSALWRWGSADLRRRMSSAARPLLAGNVAVLALVWLIRMAGGSIPAPFLG